MGRDRPVAARLTGTPYSNARLLGRLVTRQRVWPVVGVAMHVANGAVFGAVFGLRGAKAGVIAAEVENTLLWPTMAIADKVHPDRRDGTWPPFLSSPGIAAQEVAGHAIFGAVLGAPVSRSRRS